MTSREPKSAAAGQKIYDSLVQAAQHHQAGRLAEAERLYRGVLQTDPRNSDANHNLGVLAMQVGKPAFALPHFKLAFEAQPQHMQYWIGYVRALVHAGDLQTAQRVHAEGSARGLQGPTVAFLQSQFAASTGGGAQRAGAGSSRDEQSALVELFRLGKLAEAEALARSLVARFPEHGFGWKTLGMLLIRLGRIEEALGSQQQAVRLFPDDSEAHFGLGEVLWRLHRLDDAAASWRRAIDLILSRGDIATLPADMRALLNLSLSRMAHIGFDETGLQKQVAYQAWQHKRNQTRLALTPRVSVVIPSYNHAAFIQECLESVYRQSWAHIELIVIDDGSRDGSADLIRQSLKTCPFPHRFIARQNRGAHATINEGIELASGEYINILNSDDRFTPDRIERMVQGVAAIGAEWGFAGVGIIDESGHAAALSRGSMAEQLHRIVESTNSAPTVGFALVRHNVAISTGNFFFRKAFLDRIGGFSDLRYNHDWEFALRATLSSEPVYLPETHYLYRLHGNNTIAESASAARNEACRLFEGYIGSVFADAPVSNPFAPTHANWGALVPNFLYRCNWGALLPPGVISDVAKLPVSGMVRHAPPPDLRPLASLAELSPVVSLLDELERTVCDVTATFDQHQRYAMAVRAIELLRHGGQSFSILEVGANTHKLLGRLLPHDKITYLEREIPAGMQRTEDVVIGDATDLPMADGSFDIVVALDVLEHIEPGCRDAFLHNATRTARCLALIAGPFDSAAVRDTESRAQSYWSTLFDRPCYWLAQRAESGLPDFAQTIARLDELGIGYRSLGHGKLDLWREFLCGHFSAEFYPGLRNLIAAVDCYYQGKLFCGDTDEHGTYRQYLFCSRLPEILDKLQALCVDMKAAAQPEEELQPVFDVLYAIQAIALGKRRTQRALGP